MHFALRGRRPQVVGIVFNYLENPVRLDTWKENTLVGFRRGFAHPFVAACHVGGDVEMRGEGTNENRIAAISKEKKKSNGY